MGYWRGGSPAITSAISSAILSETRYSSMLSEFLATPFGRYSYPASQASGQAQIPVLRLNATSTGKRMGQRLFILFGLIFR